MAERVSFSEFGYLYRQTFRQARRAVLWTPLLLETLVALLLALIHLYIFSPITGPLIKAWIGIAGSQFGDAYFHYPAQYALMPYFLGTARLLVNAFIEGFLFGVVIDMLMALYRGERPLLMTSFGQALKRYLPLTVAWLVVVAILYLVNRYFTTIIQDVFGYSLQNAPRRQVAADFSLRGVTILIYSVFVFLLPSIMAGGVSFVAAVKRGLAMFFRHPFVAIGLVLLPYLIGFLPSWATSDPNRIVVNFSPELVFYLLLISIGLDVIVNFLLLGTAVKFYMDQSA